MLAPLQTDSQTDEDSIHADHVPVVNISQIDYVHTLVQGNSLTLNVPPGAQVIVDKSTIEINDAGDKYSSTSHNDQSVHYNTYHQSNQTPSRRFTSREIDVATRDLKRRLESFYSQATLPRIPWMHKGADLCLRKFYAQLKLDSPRTPKIELQDIFVPLKNEESEETRSRNKYKILQWFTRRTEPPKRIFVEGKAGYGKTTLTSKLAYDWAVGEKYMRRFKLVFVVQLRRIQNVESALRQEAEKCGFKQLEMLAQVVDKNVNDVLILLDGYDEISPGSITDAVHKVLYKTDYSEATVVLTCRNGMFNRHNEELLALLSKSIYRKLEFWDRKVNVCGLDEMGQRKMLQDFLTTDESLAVFEHFQGLTDPVSDILKSPLILMLLGFLYANGKDIQFDLKNTNLFKDIVNGLVSYNVRKKYESINRNIDLFGNQQEVPELLIEDFVEFGRICLQYLEESKFEFEDSDLMERIYLSGFLTKIESKCNFETKTSFEPIHRSFVEFFTAFSIWHEFHKSDENLLEETTILSLNRIFFNTQGTSLVLPFLVGMLKSEAHNFFNQLPPYAQLYVKHPRGWCKILEECTETDQVIESLLSFIPLEMSLTDEKITTSNLFGRLMLKANEQSKLHSLNLYLDDEEEYSFPQKIHFKQISVRTATKSLAKVYDKYKLLMQNVSCSQIQFIFTEQMKSGETTREMLIKFMNIFEKPELQRRLFYIEDDSFCNVLTSCFKSQAMRGKKIHHLLCHLTGDGDWEEFLKLALTGNQVEALQLCVKNENSWKKMEGFLKSADSSHLLGLSIDNDFDRLNRTVNLKSLGELKKWDYLALSRIKVTCDITERFQTNELVLTNGDVTLETVLNSDLSVLDCPSTLVAKLVEFGETHSIFLSVTELAFSIGKECCQTFWEKLKKFQRIEKLSLAFSLKDFISPTDILNFIQSTNLILLELRIYNSTFAATADFVQHLTLLLPMEQCCLKRFQIRVGEKLPSLSKLLIPLLTCVEKKILDEICVSWQYHSYWKWESMDWVDTKKFRMDRSFLGMKETDMKYWQRWYCAGVFFDSILISLK